MQATKSTIKLRPYISRDRSLGERLSASWQVLLQENMLCIKEITYENEKRELSKVEENNKGAFMKKNTTVWWRAS